VIRFNDFLALSVNISKMVAETAKVTIRKSYMGFRLTLLKGQILSEFRVISRLWEATTAKRMKIDL